MIIILLPEMIEGVRFFQRWRAFSACAEHGFDIEMLPYLHSSRVPNNLFYEPLFFLSITA